MCLIILALNKHPDYKLVLAANRDEFFERPTLKADFWEENQEILGGKDIKSGGTWLGITKNGRFIAITNYRDPNIERSDAISRGELSKQYLTTDININDFLSQISKKKDQYNGFNLLLSEDGLDSIYYYSNITDQAVKIDDGIHGLSNHLLNTPWPKVIFGKNALADIINSSPIDQDNIMEMLKNNDEAMGNSLPNTGISYELEKKLSPVFISMKGYGTRCSTVIFVDRTNKVSFFEVIYNEKKQIIGKKSYKLQLKS